MSLNDLKPRWKSTNDIWFEQCTRNCLESGPDKHKKYETSLLNWQTSEFEIAHSRWFLYGMCYTSHVRYVRCGRLKKRCAALSHSMLCACTCSKFSTLFCFIFHFFFLIFLFSFFCFFLLIPRRPGLCALILWVPQRFVYFAFIICCYFCGCYFCCWKVKRIYADTTGAWSKTQRDGNISNFVIALFL